MNQSKCDAKVFFYIFFDKNWQVLHIIRLKFNVSLTDDVFYFEQLNPDKFMLELR